MTANYILVLDLGTTGNRAVLFNAKARMKTYAYRTLRQHYPRPSWIEHDAAEILADTLANMKAVLAQSRLSMRDIAAIGITNQRETTVVWDRTTGKPLHRAIVWQDRRTAPECDDLKKRGVGPFIHKRTGLFLDPYFSATKLAWLLKNIPAVAQAAKKGTAAFGTVDSWVLWKLTGGNIHATDVTNASRTMLMNLKTLAWDPELLRAFKIPSSLLPQIVPNTGPIGALDRRILGHAVPITAVIGDQQSSLFGHRCMKPGDTKCTYGTGAFVLENIGTQARMHPKLLTTVAWQLQNQKPVYALEGSLFTIGAVLEWLKDDLHLVKNFKEFDRIVARTPSSNGAVFVPALQGLGAPYWNPSARGAWLGLSRATSRAHILRAVAEGFAFQVADLLETFADASRTKLKSLHVDGGLSKSEPVMNLQSAALRIPITRGAAETTALGAALTAGIGADIWNPNRLPQPSHEQKIAPSLGSEHDIKQTFIQWKHALTQTDTNSAPDQR